MQKRNHIIFGFFLCFIFILFLGFLKLEWFYFTASSIAIMAGVIVFYSLLPDIDHKNSTITWWFFGIGVLGLVFGISELVLKKDFVNPLLLLIISTGLLVFTYFAVNLFEHRGIIHSVPVGILSVLPLWFLLHSVGYCMLAYVAWHSHLLGDGYLFKVK
ncbi:MAG: metal-dependent hydrolase [Nanoarchaeota archaeon]